MKLILAIYGAVLVLLVSTGLFFFFVCYKINKYFLRAGVFILLGTFIFYISDSLIAQGRFNTTFK
jgi:hypothetical protein